MRYEMWELVPGDGGPYGQNEYICRECGVQVKDLWISNKGRMARDLHEDFHAVFDGVNSLAGTLRPIG